MLGRASPSATGTEALFVPVAENQAVRWKKIKQVEAQVFFSQRCMEVLYLLRNKLMHRSTRRVRGGREYFDVMTEEKRN